MHKELSNVLSGTWQEIARCKATWKT